VSSRPVVEAGGDVDQQLRGGVEEDVLVASMAGGYEEWDFELETGAPADA